MKYLYSSSVFACVISCNILSYTLQIILSLYYQSHLERAVHMLSLLETVVILINSQANLLIIHIMFAISIFCQHFINFGFPTHAVSYIYIWHTYNILLLFYFLFFRIFIYLVFLHLSVPIHEDNCESLITSIFFISLHCSITQPIIRLPFFSPNLPLFA